MDIRASRAIFVRKQASGLDAQAAPAPVAAGLGGKLTVVNDIHGQVAYNVHPLYTFAGDRPGQGTGQGVQGFAVVTPGVAPIAAAGTAAGAVPATPSGGGYGGY